MENSRKLNLTSHFFLRLPRKAESVYVHVCVCISHTYSLPHSSPENVVCVTACWQPYSHFHRLVKTAHHHMPNVYPELCVFLDACVLLCVWEKRGNVWCFTHQTWFQSLSFTVTRMEKLWMWHCVRDVSFFLYLSFSVSAPPRSSQTFPLHIKTYENCCTLPKLIGFMYCRSKAFAHTHTHTKSIPRATFTSGKYTQLF